MRKKMLNQKKHFSVSFVLYYKQGDLVFNFKI